MSILAEILRHKRAEVAAAKLRQSAEQLTRACAERGPTVSLAAALRRPAGQLVRVIAEIKRASPSAGAIRADADPVEIAVGYEQGGAAALSVLTDEHYFDGHLSFLGRVRPAVSVPLLRKDFLIDPYQVVEARSAGADAVLLIVAALSDAALGEMLAEVARFHMEALVEVHDGSEAERAVAAGARIVGINHRNLATFEVDTTLTGRLRPSLPADVIVVGESGIRTSQDLQAMTEAGADAVLVGERLMRAPSPGAALSQLLAEAAV